ncbi:MAG: SDR family NAD(P)-dependent oxidoreductase [Anderseniella sp.]|nr:SDR family NAD(P)-dependent oxidoreductase [Anderseniella sp.]
MTDLSGRHALVTGGGSGVGAAIAHALADAGCHVTITGRTAAALEAVCADHGHIRGVAADVTDLPALRAAFARAADDGGHVPIVVANAGIAESQPFHKLEPAQWQRMIDINLTGVFNTFKVGLEHMAGAGWGRMVAIASTAGLQGGGYISAYSASKHGVVGLVRSLAIELGPKHITVNAVCPGYIDTPMTDRTLANITSKTGMSREEAAKQLLKDVPTGRFITAAEVAGSVLWLCSDAARSITGETVVINGGQP